MRPDLPSGTVTFLFTDIEGSTRLLHELGPAPYASALGEHRRLLRGAFVTHGGVEVDTQGDAFFVAFPTAAGAAVAAQDGRDALAGGPVRVRIGLHTGAPTVTDEGYVGVDVHRGARIAALAHGGQILLSPATAELLDDAELVDLGRHRLKDFDGATRVYQLGSGDFPALRTPGSIELPRPATVFIGREQELFDAVSVVLERDPGVLTILGPGGTGKTRFALELARLLADEAEGGTVFVPLAPVRDPGLVGSAVAQTLGAATPAPASVAAATRGRRTHVVLDNLEHLLPAAAVDVAGLVEGVPSLRLLVTSREALRIQGEEEFDLPPLAESEAATFFVARARAVRPGVELTGAVEELCRRLDRLPLALELAAAHTKLLSPEALLERLGGRLDFLRGSRDADPRHATLRATIAWSYDLLSPREQALFARLSVFAAGCTLESAEAVCDADLDTLRALLDKSLLRRRIGALGEDRFWLLETIREFAAERLAETGEADAVSRRHAKRMLLIAVSAHLSPETGIGFELEPQRHDIVLAERDDVRAALDWAEEEDALLGLELVLALENFWATHAREGARRLVAVLARAGPLAPDLTARALRMQGNDASRLGKLDLGMHRYEESLAAYRALGDERGVAIVLTRLAINAAWSGDTGRSRRLAEEALSAAQALGLAWLESQARGVIGNVLSAEGNLEAAWEFAVESAEIARACGFRWWQARQLTHVADVGLELGKMADAEAAGLEALRLAGLMEDRAITASALDGLAAIHYSRGDVALAGRLWGAVAAENERQRPARSGPGPRPLTPRAGPAHDPRLAPALAEGHALELEDAAALALGEGQTVP